MVSFDGIVMFRKFWRRQKLVKGPENRKTLKLKIEPTTKLWGDRSPIFAKNAFVAYDPFHFSPKIKRTKERRNQGKKEIIGKL